jgi:hypothetical protein
MSSLFYRFHCYFKMSTRQLCISIKSSDRSILIHRILRRFGFYNTKSGWVTFFTWVEIACTCPSSPSSLCFYELGLTRCYLVYCTTAQVAISIASSAVASQASVYSLEHSGSSSINTTATTGTMTTSGASSTVTGNSTSTGLNTTSGLSSGATTTTSGASGSTTNQATGTSSSGGLDAAAISSAVSPPFFSLSDTTQCEMQRH